MTPRHLLVALLAVLTVGLTGCWTGDQHQISSNPAGTNEEAGDLLLLGVRVAGPAAPAFPEGADAPVWLSIVNEGTAVDVLRSVSSPVAGEVEIRWDRACDGTAEVVDELPIRPAGTDRPPAGDPSPAAAPYDAYHLRLVDVTDEVRAGTSIAMTFTFARAGEHTLQVPVRPQGAQVDPGSVCV